MLSAEAEPLLSAEPIPELRLSDGQSVASYLGPFTARIDVPDTETDLLAESTVALRAPEDGTEQPLDSELVFDGDHYEAENAPVEAEISPDVSRALRFAGSGIEIGLGAGSDPAQEASDKLFYANVQTDTASAPSDAANAPSDAANVQADGANAQPEATSTPTDAANAQADTDTDILVTPTPAGAEVSYQLRSAASPEVLPLTFTLPAGATLEPTPDGGAAVRDAGGQAVVEVAAPAAWDAEGTPLPASYAVSGQTLEVRVPHRDRDLLFPLTVDPAITHNYDFATNPARENWFPRQSFGGFSMTQVSDGLRSDANAGYSYPYWSIAQWEISSIGDSFIERVDYWDFARYTGAPATCTTVGIWDNASEWWEPGTVQDIFGNPKGYGGLAVENICDQANVSIPHDYRFAWVGSDPNPQNWVFDRTGAAGNKAVFTLETPNPGYRSVYSMNKARNVTVHRWDFHPPTASYTGGVRPSTWRDDQNLTETLTARGVDGGLGMKWLELSGSADDPGAIHHELGCDASRTNPCPAAFTSNFDYRLREGKQRLNLVGSDVTNNLSPAVPLVQRIDRSAPDVLPLSGSMVDNANAILTSNDYELNLSATDGSKIREDLMRSGVTKLEAFVDARKGDPGAEASFTATQPCTDPDGSCPMNATWPIEARELSVGPHTIRVYATDARGHVSVARQLSVTVRDDPNEPDIAISAGQPDASGNYVLSINITDNYAGGPADGTYRSGAEDLELYLDGEFLDAKRQECPQGGCSLAYSRQMTGSQSLSQHEVSAIAYDRAGNSDARSVGDGPPDFDYFGYNDSFRQNQEVALAGQGGARVIRFPVIWCRTETEDDQFHWGETDVVFNQIDAYNTGHPSTPIRAIPELLSAPIWADDDPSNDDEPINDEDFACPEFTQPPIQSKFGLNSWAGFASAFEARYAGRGTILAIEAWNEPNLAEFWGGGGQQFFDEQPGLFAQLVNRAAAALTLPVFPGGLANADVIYDENNDPKDDPVRYMRDATNPAAQNHILSGEIGGLSVHLYANKKVNNRKSVNQIGTRYREFEDGLRSGFTGMDRWITEVGFPSDGLAGSGLDYATKATQRQRLRETYTRFAKKAKVRAFIVHRLRDIRQTSEDPMVATENGRFGVVNRTGPPKWIYCWLAEEATGTALADGTCEEKTAR